MVNKVFVIVALTLVLFGVQSVVATKINVLDKGNDEARILFEVNRSIIGDVKHGGGVLGVDTIIFYNNSVSQYCGYTHFSGKIIINLWCGGVTNVVPILNHELIHYVQFRQGLHKFFNDYELHNNLKLICESEQILCVL